MTLMWIRLWNRPSVGLGIALAILAAAMMSCGGGGASTGSGSTGSGAVTKAQLGKALFFDATLSNPPGEACATCHSPAKAFTDPRPGPTSQGAVAGLFGFRKAPSISYMAFSPPFQAQVGVGLGSVGGQFWDGRARDLPSQAKFPLLNPIEMNNASAAAVINTVQAGPEAAAMKAIYGANIFKNADTALDAVVDAIAAFEATPEVSPFTSLYDAYLAGTAQLTASQLQGLALFNGKGRCTECHIDDPTTNAPHPVFTGYCYANLGLPKNPSNPYYTIPAKYNPLGAAFIDIGLQTATGNPGDEGNFMTPPLRNVTLKAPYFHNGLFTTLKEVVHFYNTRNLWGFGTPEVPANEDLDPGELGNLGLTDAEEDEIVDFLGTLTDGYTSTPSLTYSPKVKKVIPRLGP